jgi:serine O-acetyltransferase
MTRLSDFLDADWARLAELSNTSPGTRKLLHALSPRFAPIVLVRTAQCLNISGWSRLAKVVALANFILFGIEVPTRLSIGLGLVLMHTQGTVLGAASIGKNVTIYHQVTLGALVMDFDYNPRLRPTIGDGVVIGVGAKILGGLILGNNSVVGANAVVINDVPTEHVAIGIPAKILPPKKLRISSTSMK